MNKEIGFRGGKIPDKTGIGSKEEAMNKLREYLKKLNAEQYHWCMQLDGDCGLCKFIRTCKYSTEVKEKS